MTPKNYENIINYLAANYEKVSGDIFYKELFPHNENSNYQRTLDIGPAAVQPNAIYYIVDEIKSKEQKRAERGIESKLFYRIMTADTWEQDYLDVKLNPRALCGGLAYVGRKNLLAKARQMNAMIFDLDNVNERALEGVFRRINDDRMSNIEIPRPTYIAASGTGLHIYYAFEEPVPLTENIILQLNTLKSELTRRLWEYPYTSANEKIQYQGINQPFRMVGSMNEKYGTEVIGYRVGPPVTLDFLNSYAREEFKVDITKIFKPTKNSLNEAKKLYPEWYDKVILNKDKKAKTWDRSKQGDALYQWWLKRIDEIQEGARYNYMLHMVAYAKKCNVPKKQLTEDMLKVYENLKTKPAESEITEEEMQQALKTYNNEIRNYRLSTIHKHCHIEMPKNKRNGETQKYHLEDCRDRKVKMKQRGQEFKNPEGRPKGSGTKEDIVKKYIKENPGSSVTKIARNLKISRPTIYKYLK